MKKKLTIKEFAKQLNVSTATVSRAFSTKGRISEETRQHIIEKAKELGYYANINAQNLASPKSNTVGFFYPFINSAQPDFFITELQQGIIQSLIKTGCQLQSHPLPNDDKNSQLDVYRNCIFSGALGGIIVVAGSRESNELVKIAAEAGVPYSVIGYMSQEKKNCVVFDNASGAEQAGKYFLKSNRKKPVYVGGHLDKRKQNGFRMGLGDIADEVVVLNGGHSFQDGAQAFMELSLNHSECDCVLCANDVLAAGFIKAALNKGLRVPEDIAVIGFDNNSFSGFFTPSISTVSLNLNSIGEASAEMVSSLMSKQEVRPIHIGSDLIIRESS